MFFIKLSGTPQKQGKHNSVHNDSSEVDDIEGAEDTVVPSTPVRTAAVSYKVKII